MKLEGRKAIITGATRGFGAEIARHFVREGAVVLICGRTATALEEVRSRLLEQAPGPERVFALKADVSRERDVDALFDCAGARLGGCDVLVNCAGVCGPAEPCASSNWSEWKKAVEINIHGTVYPCLKALPIMKSAGYGKIVNISGGGATKPLKNLSAYATSKAAIVRFTETLALEIKPCGIDVNAVAPGVLYTALVDEFLKAGVESLGEGYLREVEGLKKNGQPAMDRAASLCVYLASSESDGITGRLISAVWDPWEDLARHCAELEPSDIYTLRRIVPADRGMDWGEGLR
jgi:NAD(P)-dependent dehydrogenase (short-subunit alcohol dehydrogenase family)